MCLENKCRPRRSRREGGTPNFLSNKWSSANACACLCKSVRGHLSLQLACGIQVDMPSALKLRIKTLMKIHMTRNNEAGEIPAAEYSSQPAAAASAQASLVVPNRCLQSRSPDGSFPMKTGRYLLQTSITAYDPKRASPWLSTCTATWTLTQSPRR